MSLEPTLTNTDARGEIMGATLDSEIAFPLADIVGAVIDGRYKIVSVIGKGGVGIVYRAEHLVMNRPVAFKVLSHKSAGNRSIVKRFMREAAVMSKLKHPNIVEVFGCGIWNELPYLVMEFLDGETLATVLRASGPQPVDRARPIFLQIADALDHAHANGIVHRDLKPSNVVLLDDGARVKLVDFGIAALIADENVQKLTQTGDIFGTVQYMSPEQCMGRPVDARSDIYSFGCLVYEAMTGAPPFEGETAFSVVSQQLAEPPRSNPALDELEPVVLRCLAKKPEERPASAAELKQMLITPHAVPSSALVPKRTIKNGNRWMVLAGAGLATAMLILVAFLVERLSSISPTHERISQSAEASRDEINRAMSMLTEHDPNALGALRAIVNKTQDRTTTPLIELEERLASELYAQQLYSEAAKYAHEVAENGLKAREKAKNDRGLAALQTEADSCQSLGMMKEAFAAYLKLANESGRLEKPKYRAYAYLKCCQLANALGAYDEAIAFGVSALKLSSSPDSSSTAHLWMCHSLTEKLRRCKDIAQRRILHDRAMALAQLVLSKKDYSAETKHAADLAQQYVARLNTDPECAIDWHPKGDAH